MALVQEARDLRYWPLATSMHTVYHKNVTLLLRVQARLAGDLSGCGAGVAELGRQVRRLYERLDYIDHYLKHHHDVVSHHTLRLLRPGDRPRGWQNRAYYHNMGLW